MLQQSLLTFTDMFIKSLITRSITLYKEWGNSNYGNIIQQLTPIELLIDLIII